MTPTDREVDALLEAIEVRAVGDMAPGDLGLADVRRLLAALRTASVRLDAYSAMLHVELCSHGDGSCPWDAALAEVLSALTGEGAGKAPR